GFERTPCAQICLLDEVFRLVQRPRHAIAVGLDLTPVGFRQHRESVTTARLHHEHHCTLASPSLAILKTLPSRASGWAASSKTAATTSSGLWGDFRLLMKSAAGTPRYLA